MSAIWPKIPFKACHETCSALHLYSQIVGKYRLARTPWVNHSWHATFYVNARGLTTSLIPDASGIEILFDLVNHAVIGEATDGRRGEIPLGPMSVAGFHTQFRELVARLGGTPEFDGRPNEVADPIPFRDDRHTRPSDAEAVTRFLRSPRFDQPCLFSVSDRVHRKGQSGPSLLGQLRSRGDPLLRAYCPASSRRHSGVAGRRDARGIQ